MLEQYSDILTTEEVAQILRFNPKTILKMARNKTIPSIKVGNQTRFIKEKIIQWFLSESIKSQKNNQNNEHQKE